MIRFEDMMETMAEKPRNGKGVCFSKTFEDDNVKIVLNRLTPGSAVGYHEHVNDYEMAYVINGHGIHTIDGKVEEIKAGDCLYCPKGHSHSTENTGDEDMFFFAVFPKEK